MHIFKSIKVLVATLGLTALAIVGVTEALSRSARASNQHITNYSGVMCVPSAFAPTGTVEASQFGVHNPSALGDVRVICPMPIDAINGTTVPIGVNMGAYDRSSTSNITCNVMKQSTTGSGILENLGTFSTVNGGPTDGFQTPGFSFPNPISISFWTLYLDCIIPKTQSGAASHLQTYSLVTVGL